MSSNNKLRAWRIIALAIARQHTNHERRKKLVNALNEMIIRSIRLGETDENTSYALQTILYPILYQEMFVLDHTLTRDLLRLFAVTCEFYLSGKLDIAPLEEFDQPFDVNDIPF